jgi:hypothetical protein
MTRTPTTGETHAGALPCCSAGAVVGGARRSCGPCARGPSGNRANRRRVADGDECHENLKSW